MVTRVQVCMVQVYAFSTENFSRPPAEVEFLMGLIGRIMELQLSKLLEMNGRMQFFGDIASLPASLQRIVQRYRQHVLAVLLYIVAWQLMQLAFALVLCQKASSKMSPSIAVLQH